MMNPRLDRQLISSPHTSDPVLSEDMLKSRVIRRCTTHRPMSPAMVVLCIRVDMAGAGKEGILLSLPYV